MQLHNEFKMRTMSNVLLMSVFRRTSVTTIVGTAQKNVCCCLNIYQRLKYSINWVNGSHQSPTSIARFFGHVKGFYAASVRN